MGAVERVGSEVATGVVFNQAEIKGRIKSVSTFEVKGRRMHEAVVMIAAADEFSMPGAVAVQSTYRLGNAGEDWRGTVRVTGIPNSWNDRATGEVKESANVRLVVIE